MLLRKHNRYFFHESCYSCLVCVTEAHWLFLGGCCNYGLLWQLADREFESTSNSSESEAQDSVWSLNSLNRCSPLSSSDQGNFNFVGCITWNPYAIHRNYSEALTGSETLHASSGRKDNVPQEVLESFYNIHRSPQHEPRTMNWRSIAKKMSQLSTGPNDCNSIKEPCEDSLISSSPPSFIGFWVRSFFKIFIFFRHQLKSRI